MVTELLLFLINNLKKGGDEMKWRKPILKVIDVETMVNNINVSARSFLDNSSPTPTPTPTPVPSPYPVPTPSPTPSPWLY